MIRLIRKAIWSWQDWQTRRKLPRTNQLRSSLFQARKKHRRTKHIQREARKTMLEQLRAEI